MAIKKRSSKSKPESGGQEAKGEQGAKGEQSAQASQAQAFLSASPQLEPPQIGVAEVAQAEQAEEVASILLVEDNPADVLILRSLLAKASAIGPTHFHVVHVERLSEAIAYLSTPPSTSISTSISTPTSTSISTPTPTPTPAPDDHDAGISTSPTPAGSFVSSIAGSFAGPMAAILLDLSLPDSSGLDAIYTLRALRTLRKHHEQSPGGTRHLAGIARAPIGEPIIVLTDVEDETLAAQAMQAGAEDYLVKSHLDTRTLTRAVLSAIQRKRMEEALRASEMRLSGIVDIADDAIISVDEAQRIVMFNQGAEKIFGYSMQEAMGRPLDLLLPVELGHIHRRHVANFGKSPDLSRKMGERREISGCRKDGTRFPAEASISKLNLGGERVYTVILRDITQRKMMEQELERRVEERTQQLSQANQHLEVEIAGRKRMEGKLREMAATDELTGLFNRREFNRLLADEARRYRRYGRPLSLIIADIDHFKQVNDTWGHQVGDAVLRRIAQMISSNLRTTDKVARYGGEEIVVILAETEEADAYSVAEHLRTLIASTPFTVPDGQGPPQQIEIKVSMGVAAVSPGMSNEDELLLAADSALYQAKEEGRNCTRRFTARL